jgi:hypothetical protein
VVRGLEEKLGGGWTYRGPHAVARGWFQVGELLLRRRDIAAVRGKRFSHLLSYVHNSARDSRPGNRGECALEIPVDDGLPTKGRSFKEHVVVFSKGCRTLGSLNILEGREYAHGVS